MGAAQKERIQRLIDVGRGKDLDWILCVLPENIFYFSGFRTMFYTRFIGVLVPVAVEREPVLIASYIDHRLVQDKIWSPHWLEETLVWGPGSEYAHKTPWDALQVYLRPGVRLGVDAIQYDLYEQLLRCFPGLTVVSLQSQILDLRMVKHADEIEKVRTAFALTEKVLARVPEWLQKPMNESDLAAEIDYAASKEGAEAMFYPTLVSCGAKMMAYHSPPLRRPIVENELIRIALGIQIDGYGSDMVRSFCKGTPPAEILPLKEAFFEAQETVFELLRPGASSQDLLKGVAQVYERRGCLKNWSWNIGHGLALTIHEAPRIAGADETIMREGMILAIEPGLACPPFGAFAHCDGVVVTKSGCERLSSVMRDLVLV
jgi:Xaa-Pro dipeptidase